MPLSSAVEASALGDPRLRAHLVHPGPRRVHDHRGAEGGHPVREQVADADAGDLAAGVAQHLFDLSVVEGAGAVAAGRQRVLEAEPLGEDEEVVEVVAGPAEARGADGGLEAERVDGAQHAVPLAVPPGRQVVQCQLETDANGDEPLLESWYTGIRKGSGRTRWGASRRRVSRSRSDSRTSPKSNSSR